MMTTQEIASKYGVPMPETCIALNWQNETIFYWYFNHEWLLTSKEEVEMAEDYFSDFEMIEAPQMHEAASFLEDKLPTLRLCLEHKSEYLYTIDEITNDVDYCVNVCVNHYAEAYAQMYLELKEANLL